MPLSRNRIGELRTESTTHEGGTCSCDMCSCRVRFIGVQGGCVPRIKYAVRRQPPHTSLWKETGYLKSKYTRGENWCFMPRSKSPPMLSARRPRVFHGFLCRAKNNKREERLPHVKPTCLCAPRSPEKPRRPTKTEAAQAGQLE